MKYFTNKLAIYIFLLLFTSCAHRVKYNPYLTMKVKPSEQLRKENEKNMDKAKLAYDRQLVKNKEEIKKNNEKFFNKKKQYHFKVSRKRKLKKAQF